MVFSDFLFQHFRAKKRERKRNKERTDSRKESANEIEFAVIFTRTRWKGLLRVAYAAERGWVRETTFDTRRNMIRRKQQGTSCLCHKVVGDWEFHLGPSALLAPQLSKSSIFDSMFDSSFGTSMFDSSLHSYFYVAGKCIHVLNDDQCIFARKYISLASNNTFVK